MQAIVSGQLKIRYYDVEAKGVNDLIKNVANIGPTSTGKQVWALIHWDLNTEYHHFTDDAGCKLLPSRVEVLAEVVLPRWSNVEETAASNAVWWVDFEQFIKQHEVSHYENALAGAEKLAELMDAMPPQRSCELARENYLTIKHQALDFIFKQDALLDRAAKTAFFNNEALFGPLRQSSRSIVIESGIMRSYIGL